MANRTTVVALTLAVAMLAACSTTQYIISTNDGTLIQSDGKPVLDPKTGMYQYKDSEGRSVFIQKDQVKQILER